MEFRGPEAASTLNKKALDYLTKELSNSEKAFQVCADLFEELGNAVESYPEWHPLLTLPKNAGPSYGSCVLNDKDTYKGIDHTIKFVKGFITCPYSETAANDLINNVNEVMGLHAYSLPTPLYSDMSFPVVIVARDIELEGDGTIRSRDALIWYTELLAKDLKYAEVGETWWNVRSTYLGCPSGARSSLFVNQYTGSHMKKILETLNASGVYGPIKEWSLDMLSEKKRKTISETLIKAAINAWDKSSESFEFELRGEICKANIRDTWNDGSELFARVKIGENDLCADGFMYPDKATLQVTDPNGKRALAEKFL